VSSTALDSFLDKWRSRWPEWSVAAPFVAESQRELAVAWFALLQEFDDMLNTGGDPLPADAKLAWWGEELRSWAGHRSRHPLGRLLEPVRAPWAQLAEALPDLVEARTVALDAAAPSARWPTTPKPWLRSRRPCSRHRRAPAPAVRCSCRPWPSACRMPAWPVCRAACWTVMPARLHSAGRSIC
jgi:hypothetical protein